MFKVAVMGYRNSPAYIQRMIDKVLRQQHEFARVYVDDIVIFSVMLKEHLQHLDKVFNVLTEKNICLSPKKSYLGYPSVKLLGQRVDTLELVTAADKLAVITQLKFLKALSALEKYLSLTEYLRQYILKYAAIVKPLQE